MDSKTNGQLIMQNKCASLKNCSKKNGNIGKWLSGSISLTIEIIKNS